MMPMALGQLELPATAWVLYQVLSFRARYAEEERGHRCFAATLRELGDDAGLSYKEARGALVALTEAKLVYSIQIDTIRTAFYLATFPKAAADAYDEQRRYQTKPLTNSEVASLMDQFTKIDPCPDEDDLDTGERSVWVPPWNRQDPCP